ncbi:MAG: T9SS type A sorting domain-containing protein [Bacteroidetes bacterium]|nr:T9SS type A sorting domain-containing protein [Bacteroidota bacterium]MCK5764781.1 T9SS type A sorting domain-containing protein [Bacteroidales bacterium]
MPFNKAYLLISLLVFGFTCQSQTIIPGGYVSGNWDQWSSPYLIQDDITIHEDSVLNISGNVEIIFQDTAGLDVYGVLQAIGGNISKIEFTAEVDTWEGIQIYGNGSPATDSVILDHCIISKGAAFNGELNGGGLWISNRDEVRVSRSSIGGNYAEHKGGGIYIENSDILIIASCIEMNATSQDSLDANGGGMYVKDSNPVFLGVLFYGNESRLGGGLYGSNSSLVIFNCGFQENSSISDGGAICCSDNGSLNMDYCDFFDNTAGNNGGSIALLYGISTNFSYVNFVNSKAGSLYNSGIGGALYISTGNYDQRFENCTFIENSATVFGGAMYSGSYVYLSNCLFNTNTLTSVNSSFGGAVALYYISLWAVNCTFSNNNSKYGTTFYSTSAGIDMMNCILWDPFPNPDATAISLFYLTMPPSVFIEHSNIQFGEENISGNGIITWANGNIDEYPAFVLPQEDFSLDWNSPCINAGRSDTLVSMIPETDLNGETRISGGEVDMGAYEYQGPISINELYVKNQINITPNPNNGCFIIHLDKDFILPARIELYTIAGNITYVQRISSQIEQVNLPQLPDGVYILKLKGKGEFGTTKMIIKN